MTATTASPMKSLYKRLTIAGYSKKFVQKLLPEWWDDEIATTPAGFQQTCLMLATRLSVRADSLWSEDNSCVLLKLPQGICFKKNSNKDIKKLEIACAISRSIAQVALKAFPHTKPQHWSSASALRNQILNEGHPWIDFALLLRYCLNAGILVLFLEHLPSSAHKMAGLAFEYDGRPVIVLTQIKPFGYLLFDLAHELGHISLGHVNADHTVIDSKIERDTKDEEEQEANRFALELITGDPEASFSTDNQYLSGVQLAKASQNIGHRHHIDPLHIALNFGHTTNKWSVAILAIKNLAGTQTDQEILLSTLREVLDFDQLNEDDLHLLQIHGITEA